ncbi:uncharacterized protein LOC143366845 [Andrena cerasifolii]|uniref:uncharacterized protein LOC143366845 n=1 Tax=Andrena cerasifolii TaxID=2819439 RepID=UPI004037641D
MRLDEASGERRIRFARLEDFGVFGLVFGANTIDVGVFPLRIDGRGGGRDGEVVVDGDEMDARRTLFVATATSAAVPSKIHFESGRKRSSCQQVKISSDSPKKVCGLDFLSDFHLQFAVYTRGDFDAAPLIAMKYVHTLCVCSLYHTDARWWRASHFRVQLSKLILA